MKSRDWKSERREEKRREEERRSKKRKSQKKEDPGARKGRKVAKYCVFPMICGSGGSKSRLPKAESAQAHFQVNVQSASASEHFLKLRCRKSARSCGTKHISKSKCTKHHLRTTFGSWDVEKVHAVVARSTFRSQNVRSTPCSDHFWKLRCRKSARRCGAKHIFHFLPFMASIFIFLQWSFHFLMFFDMPIASLMPSRKSRKPRLGKAKKIGRRRYAYRRWQSASKKIILKMLRLSLFLLFQMIFLWHFQLVWFLSPKGRNKQMHCRHGNGGSGKGGKSGKGSAKSHDFKDYKEMILN